MKTTIYPFFIHKMRNALFLLLLTVNFLSVTALFADSGFYCPPDITLGCCSDYSNTDITGHPGDTNLDYSNFSFNDDPFYG